MQHKVGVIGWPVEHSVSPQMHNAALQSAGLADWRYERIAIPPDIVGHSLRTLRDEGGFHGLNVTVPHKQAVLPYVRPDEVALALGAVNTIDFRDNSATNTDHIGLIDDLHAHGVELAGARALVLGAGGSARAAVYGLKRAGAEVAVVNRTESRASAMLAHLRRTADIRDVTLLTLEQAAGDDLSLVVNCTSLGMWPHGDSCPWPASIPFPAGATGYDLVYRPRRTRFMELVEDCGGRAIGGLGMLVRQGAASFAIWTGRQADVDVMFAAAEAALPNDDES
ncbi:MAG: shikimate dehydrogenase [Anaerolineaceae bacterium]|nr:shikimate dehydrogenase [Anaerolineaceae bacterium]MCY4022741.1 shikimate dehydrogenase [Anaerolineaceae bacterium]